MSRYSEIVDGKVLDWRYKYVQDTWHQAFYIGDILIGQVFRIEKKGWSAVSQFKHYGLCPLSGFKTKYDASQFLLKLFWGEDYGK